MKSSNAHISRSLLTSGRRRREGRGSRGHWPEECSGYGYPEVHLQKMELRCSPEASAHKSECHSIISDF